jgi:PIN domain nuclease of toxin-antitoxin system
VGIRASEPPIAQAITESLPILTHDEKFAHYPVKLIW